MTGFHKKLKTIKKAKSLFSLLYSNIYQCWTQKEWKKQKKTNQTGIYPPHPTGGKKTKNTQNADYIFYLILQEKTDCIDLNKGFSQQFAAIFKSFFLPN